LDSSSEAATKPARRKLAILIGIDQYQGDIPKLQSAVRDVRAVAQVLRELHGYETRCIEDSQATLQSLRQLLSELATQVARDDQLLLYFAGHGVADSVGEASERPSVPRGFLIPADARRESVDSFLPMEELRAAIDKLACIHILLCLDCCFAGAFRWSMSRDLRVVRRTLYHERFERYLRDPARQVLVSAAADERALDLVEGKGFGTRGAGGQNSPFAAALCAALRGEADLRIGGGPGDGVIVASELHLVVEASLRRLEERSGHPQQRPLLWALPGYDKGEFIFTVAGHSLELPSALELNEKNNPYRGLSAYDESSRRLFFGRRALTSELLARVLDQPLVAVVGGSGSGKSSLVCAGLLPELRKLTAPAWTILPPVRPGSRPLAALDLLRAALEAPPGMPLGQAVAQLHARRPTDRLLLTIDQLEELITQTERVTEREAFLSSLHELVVHSGGALHLVLTLRADFEPHFAPWLSQVQAARFLIRPMQREELREVIELPASERVLYFDPPTLVDRIIDEVAEMPGALPLLSFSLSEMYRMYLRSARDDRNLSLADYQALGEVAGALSRRADEIYAGLDAAHRATLERVMLRMVALEAGEVARRRVPRSELRYGEGHPEERRTERVLNELLAARLVVTGQDAQGEVYVEPAHDKLVLGWPPLWSLLKKEQENLPLLRRLTQAAFEWEHSGRLPARLWWQDPRLPQLVALVRKSPERVNASERAFIRSSEARRRRQRALSIGVVAAVIAVLSVLTGYSFFARQRALAAQQREQVQRQLAEQRLSDALEVAESLIFTVDRKLEPVAGAAGVRRELLDDSEKLLQKLMRNAEVRRSTLRVEEARLVQEAELLSKSGEIGPIAAAYQNYERALAIAERLAAQDPKSVADRAAAAAAHSSLGRLAEKVGRPAQEALRHHQQAVDGYQSVVLAAPGIGLWQLQLAASQGALGHALFTPEHPEQSSRILGRAIEQIRGVPAPGPQDLDGQRAWVDALLQLCSPFVAHWRATQLDAALGCHRETLRLANWLGEKAPQRQEWLGQLRTLSWQVAQAIAAYVGSLSQRAVRERDQGAWREAIELFMQAIDVSERTQDIRPNLRLAQLEQAELWGDLGFTQDASGQSDAARKSYEQALTLADRTIRPPLDPGPRRLRPLERYAGLSRFITERHEKAGRLDAACDSQAKVVAACQQLIQHEPQDPLRALFLADAQLQLGRLLLARGQSAPALAACAQGAAQLLPIIEDGELSVIHPSCEALYGAQKRCWALAHQQKDADAEEKLRVTTGALVKSLGRCVGNKSWQQATAEYRRLVAAMPPARNR